MSRKLITAVWEVTMRCNMRCKHCGSSCEDKLPGELSTDEALKLCDSLGELGMKHIAISGGEPTTREDLPMIIKRLRENKVQPNMISNGWAITEECLDELMDSGLASIALSIDGLEDTHNFMRRDGSFERSMKVFDMCKRKGLSTSSITTINKKNICELSRIKEVLIERGVERWQLQIGLPMGNQKKNSELVLDPEQMDDIIDFAYNNINDKRISIHLADCIGYYNHKAIEVRKAGGRAGKHYLWQGCAAGKHSIGILHNGDIVACTSMRDKEFIEGNIREKSLCEIWENLQGFSWSRGMKKSMLKGFCSKCTFGDICLGGCSNTRLCTEGSIYSENRYCSYSVAIKRENEKIKKYTDVKALYESAIKLSEQKQMQIAELLTQRALEIESDNVDIMNLHGYINFMLSNYEESRKINQSVLDIDPENIIGNKGMGLCLSKLGELEKGIVYLNKAMRLCDENNMDPYYDCAVTLIENEKLEEAQRVLKEARAKSEKFYKDNIELYTKICI